MNLALVRKRAGRHARKERRKRDAAELLAGDHQLPSRAFFKGGRMRLSTMIKGFELTPKEMAVLRKMPLYPLTEAPPAADLPIGLAMELLEQDSTGFAEPDPARPFRPLDEWVAGVPKTSSFEDPSEPEVFKRPPPPVQ